MADAWAVTTYFNPLQFSTRLENYRKFRKHLTLPLVTIEACQASRSDLANDDAEIVIKVAAEHTLWQKERLTNHALTSIPKSASLVVWLDCDVLFADASWFARLEPVLARAPVAQCYSELVDLPPDAPQPDTAAGDKRRTGYSIASFFQNPKAFAAHGSDDEALHLASPGTAWAARRDLLESCGLFDRMILGGGDRAFAYACYGRLDEAVNMARMTPRLAEDYRRWAERVFSAVRGRVGLIEGELLHLWHGMMADRQYTERHELLLRAGFDPAAHIRIAPSGAWEWSPGAPEDLRQAATSYFWNRLEDGRGVLPPGAR